MVEKLKQLLIETGLFSDNDYLNKYVELIIDKKTEYVCGVTQKHHIIPKYCYKVLSKTADNSKSNLVDLSYSNHILAHYYLAMCSVTDECIYYNSRSISYLLNGKSLREFNIDEIDLNELDKLYVESRKHARKITVGNNVGRKISDALLGRISPNLGNRYKRNSKSKKNPNAKNKLLSEHASNRVGCKNSFYGKKHTESTKNAISKANSKSVVMRDSTTLKELKVFDSIKSAEKFLIENGYAQGSSVSSRISKVCRDSRDDLCAYGFNWRFFKLDVSTIESIVTEKTCDEEVSRVDLF